MPRVAQAKLPELAITGKKLADHAKQLKDALAKKKKFERQMDQQVNLIHRLSTIAMPPLMEDIEGDGVNLPGIGYVELGIELYPYVKVEDLYTFFNWLDDTGNGAIAKRTIHHKTLQAWVAEQIDDAEKAAKLPDYLTIGKIPTAKLKAEKKSSKKRK